MDNVQLGNLIKIRTGKLDANASSKDGEYPFFTCSRDTLRINSYSYDCNCVLVAGNGDLNVKHYNGKFDAYQRTYIIESLKEDVLDTRYLYWFLFKYVEKLRELSIGGVIKYIKLNNLTDPIIPLPSLTEQRKITIALDQADMLRNKRKQAEILLEEYLKSVFLEMFGDPVLNTKGWEEMKFEEITDSRLGKMRDKQFITGKYLKPYLGNSNVQWFGFDLSDLQEMDFNERERIKYELKYGDLLICEGGDIGRCAIWKNQLNDCYFQKALHRVRTNKKFILAEYLQWVFWFYSKGRAFKESRTQSTIAHLTGEKLKRLLIPVPDMDLQVRFAEIISGVEELKQKMIDQSEELELQLQSLLQKSFKQSNYE